MFRRRSARSDRLLDLAIEAVSCNYAIFNRDRVLVDHSRSYEALHERAFATLPQPLRYDDLMRLAIRANMPEADEEAELRRRVTAHEAGDPHTFDRLYDNGRWMRVSKRLLPGGYVAGFALDITELKAREIATAASEARYRGLVETASVAIWQLDEDGRTLFANARLAALFEGGVPASFEAARLRRQCRAEGPGDGPFGFPLGHEEEAVILRAGTEVTVLVASSPWEPLLDQPVPGDSRRLSRRAAVLTLIDISALKSAQARAEHLAWHDVLTGLHNRAAFEHALGGLARRLGEGAAVERGNETSGNVGDSTVLLLLDLDHFKETNDRFGHRAGDGLLRAAAGRMGVVPDSHAFRIGGDEFAVLVRAPAEAAPALAARLSRAFAAPVQENGAELPLSASIGYACAPRDGATPEQLLHAADLALYSVKRGGRGGVAGYAPEMLAAAQQRHRLRAALPGALAGDGLALAWQPQFALNGGALRGVEALLRWPASPLGREARPDEFLPEAKAAALLPAIDLWVLDTALAQVAAWHGEGRWQDEVFLGGLTVAINISAATLRDLGFPATVEAALRRHGVPPPCLEIEIPEEVAAAELDAMVPVLERLQALGVRLALDDFGGGMSSLVHLVRLPVDRLKLDRSIAAGLPQGQRELAILRAVVALAQSLGIPVLAEGLENEVQARLLAREGCDEGQGFLLGRPLAAAAFRQEVLRPAMATAFAREQALPGTLPTR
ncbi:putative bifunctional diguanylate cyclase/phosphodiesterase [Roseomonas elaeocarpi]|uniref:Bifunctional diguanylate cyclase/phosphodiesterase n=1 Tax=Roseomonas elaeocarpi TaxID=907779 RepID=A0ABV6JS43_9PROT